MVRCLLKSLVLLSVLAVFTANLCAQGGFLYTNNNPFMDMNTVSAYSVAPDGSLTSLGLPVPTGGTGEGGGLFASARITVCAVGNFLYVSNGGNNTVSGFSINPDTGALTAVPGSPFPTGGMSGGAGISLGATPDGSFVYAIHGGSTNIRVFSKDPDTGSLTPVGPLVPAGPPSSLPAGAKVTPDGSFLLVALINVGPSGSVSVFSIDSDGGLTAVPGSPFPVRGSGPPFGNAAGVDVNCASNTVSVGEAAGDTTIVDVLNLDPGTGALTPIAGSPFHPNAGFNSNVPLLSPDDSTLFVSNQASDTVTVLSVAPDGSLTLVGAFFAGGGSPTATGMATDQAGTLLYVAKFPNVISVFSIGEGGVLSFIGNTTVSGNVSVLNLAAFPPKSCSAAGARR